MFSTTIPKSQFTGSFLLLLMCLPLYNADAAVTADETINLLANTPDNRIECFNGISASNIALQNAIHNEPLAQELSQKALVPASMRNVVIEKKLELYDFININLMTAITTLETEIQEEQKKFNTCMGEVTQDSFKAFEQVNFFYPRQVAAGTAVESNWIGAMDALASQIRRVQLNSATDISYKKARSIYLEVANTITTYANAYEQDMSSRMQSTWACGLTTSAAVAMLSWTRAPAQLGTTSIEQGQELIELVNAVFHDIKNGCTAHIGEDDTKSALPDFLSSYESCNEWRHYYRNSFRGCKPSTNETPASKIARNTNHILKKSLRDFATTVELIPQNRIQLILLYQALNSIRIEIAKQELTSSHSASATIKNNHKALLGEIIQISLIDVVNLLRYDDSQFSESRMGCFTGSGENGECNQLMHLVNEMTFEENKNREIIILMLSYAQATQGEQTPENIQQYTVAKKEIKRHKSYLTERSKEAEKNISKILFGNETALQILNKLNISSLSLQTQKALNGDKSNELTEAIIKNKAEADKITVQILRNVPHVQTVLAEKILGADNIQFSATQGDADSRRQLVAIGCDETCMTKLRNSMEEKEENGKYKYFPYFTKSNQRKLMNPTEAKEMFGKDFSANIATQFLDGKSSAIIFLTVEEDTGSIDNDDITGFYLVPDKHQRESNTSCLADFLKQVSETQCNILDTDRNFQITLNEALFNANSDIRIIGGSSIHGRKPEQPFLWDKSPEGSTVNLSSAILGRDHGSTLFNDGNQKGRENYNQHSSTMKDSLGYVVLYEPADTSSCHIEDDGALESGETLIISAAGRTAVKMDSLWGCQDGLSPKYDEKVCFNRCMDSFYPNTDSNNRTDTGEVSGTLSWCDGVCEKETEHPRSAYAKCIEFTQWKTDPQAKETSWSFPVRYLPPEKDAK